MDLAQLSGKPEWVFPILGKDYRFGEFRIEDLAELQAWIRKNVPHPLASIKDSLVGLPAEDRHYVLDRARAEAKSWPPQIGTPAGSLAMIGTIEGQIETLYRGLLIHQPETTPASAKKLYHALLRAKEEELISKIFAILFGNEPHELETNDPKAEGAPENPSTGA